MYIYLFSLNFYSEGKELSRFEIVRREIENSTFESGDYHHYAEINSISQLSQSLQLDVDQYPDIYNDPRYASIKLKYASIKRTKLINSISQLSPSLQSDVQSMVDQYPDINNDPRYASVKHVRTSSI